MSTFSGLLDEIDSVSIDRFDGENLKSSIYFLSHCHTDHMHGIPWIFPSLKERRDVFLYGSSITIAILKRMYPYSTRKLKVLEIGVLNWLIVPETKENICVTLLPAGHCPGSVMFLFETDKTILYTGDIRLRVNAVRQYTALHDTTDKVKKIDKIYLDTTFFSKAFCNLPSREKSIDEFYDLVSPWLRNPNNYLIIDLPANYGSETLYMHIAKKLQTAVHVSPKKYTIYEHIPEMDGAITLDPKTQIHSSCSNINKYNEICDTINEIPKKNIMTIKPSVLRWKSDDFTNGMIEKTEFCYYVCYSSHCSYTELVEILHYLKPTKIYPCVNPTTEDERIEMNKLIDKTLKDIHKDIKITTTNLKNKSNWLLPDSSNEIVEESDEDPFEFLNNSIGKKQKLSDK